MNKVLMLALTLIALTATQSFAQKYPYTAVVDVTSQDAVKINITITVKNAANVTKAIFTYSLIKPVKPYQVIKLVDKDLHKVAQDDVVFADLTLPLTRSFDPTTPTLVDEP